MTAHRVAAESEVPDRGALIVTLAGQEIGLFRVRGEIVGWRNRCPHQAAPVCRGTIDGTRLPSEVYRYEFGRDSEILQCPWHGWEFDLITGEHLAHGSRARLRRYEVEVRDGQVFVRTRR